MSVISELKTLSPYVEGTYFTERSEKDALKWMMTIDEPHERLSRSRLYLYTFDYTVVCKPGLKDEVSDKLSRCKAPTGEDI